MSTPPKPPERGPEHAVASIRKAQPYVDAVWQFIAAVAVMTWLGHWADGRFGTTPWLLVTGALLGFAAGLWSFVKVIWALDRKPAPGGKTDDDRPPGPQKDGT